MKHQAAEMEDHIWRAWGLLSNARSLGSNEAVEQLSWLRLGVGPGHA